MIAPLRSDGSAIRPMGIRLSHSSRRTGLASRMTADQPHLAFTKAKRRTLGQVGEDVSWRDTVDPDLVVCPLDGERSGHVSNSSLGEVVWGLGLGDVDNLIISHCQDQLRREHTDPDMEPIMTIDPPSGMSLDASSAQNQVPMTLISRSFRIFSVG